MQNKHHLVHYVHLRNYPSYVIISKFNMKQLMKRNKSDLTNRQIVTISLGK